MTNENPNKHLYMDAQKYSELIQIAHSSYIQSRLYGQKESHIADLAIETASFFEAFYHIMDAYADVTRTPNFTIKVKEGSDSNAYWDEIMKKVKAQAAKEKKQPKKERKQVKEK
jgi:hypothetical protein